MVFSLNSLSCLLFTLFLCAGWSVQESCSDQLEEYSVKAAFIYNFALLNRWPESSFLSSSDEIDLCIIGDSDSMGAFEKIDGKKVGKRHLKVHFIQNMKLKRGCHMIFFNKTAETATVLSVLAQVKGLPVLTIGDKEDFLTLGGVINFFNKNGRQYFKVSLKNMNQQQINLSSRLLKIGTVNDKQ